MPEGAEQLLSRPRATSGSRRKAWIEKIQDYYHRTPTSNELLAIDNLPCAPQTQLSDRSQPGIYAYQRLRYAEATGDVSVLAEAGRILRIQMASTSTPATSISDDLNSIANVWTPTTSICDDQSSMPDPPAENRDNQAPRIEGASTQAEIPSARRPSDTPVRPSSPAEHAVQPAGPAPAVEAHIIRGDVYYMPITLRFDSQVCNSSISINLPAWPTATYPEVLKTGGRPEGAAERPPVPIENRDWAGRARSSANSLGAALGG